MKKDRLTWIILRLREESISTIDDGIFRQFSKTFSISKEAAKRYVSKELREMYRDGLLQRSDTTPFIYTLDERIKKMKLYNE